MFLKFTIFLTFLERWLIMKLPAHSDFWQMKSRVEGNCSIRLFSNSVLLNAWLTVTQISKQRLKFTQHKRSSLGIGIASWYLGCFYDLHFSDCVRVRKCQVLGFCFLVFFWQDSWWAMIGICIIPICSEMTVFAWMTLT